jgi:multidrug efflux pump subunit AcrB
MSGIIDWFARNSVAANLLMVFIVVSGAFSAFSVKQEVFPEINLDQISISVAYPGAAPEEIEDMIKQRELARSSKNFTEADEIRNRLLRSGVIIEDGFDGTRWRFLD